MRGRWSREREREREREEEEEEEEEGRSFAVLHNEALLVQREVKERERK